MTLPESFRPCPPIYHIAKECLVILDIFKKRVVWSICLEHRNFKYMPFFPLDTLYVHPGDEEAHRLFRFASLPRKMQAHQWTLLCHTTHTHYAHTTMLHTRNVIREKGLFRAVGEREGHKTRLASYHGSGHTWERSKKNCKLQKISLGVAKHT